MLNTGRLLKCNQSYTEENEAQQKQAVGELSRRIHQLESAASSADQHQLQWEASQDKAVQVATSLCPPNTARRFLLLQLMTLCNSFAARFGWLLTCTAPSKGAYTSGGS